MNALIRAASMLVVAAGCGGPPPCARSMDCGDGLVCGFDGTCAPLRAPEGARFAGSRWLHPIDWGLAGTGEPLDDALPIGGPRGAEALLAFGPLPPASEILRALLVLHPHDPTARIGPTTEVVVEHVEPFRGGPLPPRSGAQPLRFAAARRPLDPGLARPLRVDVTEAARQAAGRGDRSLYLLLRLRHDDDGAVLFASPWYAGSRERPRLELLTH